MGGTLAHSMDDDAYTDNPCDMSQCEEYDERNNDIVIHTKTRLT